MADDNLGAGSARGPSIGGITGGAVATTTVKSSGGSAGSISLCENLERTDRHPVLIFGSESTGKSNLILSFIEGLKTTKDVDCSLGAPVLDLANSNSAAKQQVAKQFFERGVYDLARGEPIKATIGDPFFIPIDVKPKNNIFPPVKFAFLDGRGERFSVNDQSTGLDLFKELDPEVRDLLNNFPHGITIVYVAPYSLAGDHARDTVTASFALVGAMSGYRTHRAEVMRERDHHLFLMTKWDQHAPPTAGNHSFDQVNPEAVNALLDDRYRHAWGEFCGLPLHGVAQERRAFMHYTAGHFVNELPSRPPAYLAASYARYPRTVLNWLYGNAASFKLKVDDEVVRLRKILFNDVVPPQETRVSITDWLAAILTAR
jgi:hypothetical protein